MDKLLSIVVPVYNVEAYIDECINSVLSQVDMTCEIILVNDGSTDSCGTICDRYQKNNSNVSVIHKENGGLASARNAGLDIACGKYICFLDSDDRIADGAIKQILEWAKRNDTDLCFMQAVKFYPDGKVEDLGDDIKASDIAGKSKSRIIQCLTSKAKYPGSSCTKLYKLSFLREKNITFPRERVLSEDLGFVLDVINFADSFDCLDFGYYQYRQNRKGSITNKVGDNTLDGLIKFIDDSVAKLTVDNAPINDCTASLMGYVAYEYSVLLLNFSKYTGRKEKYISYLKQKRWVLNYSRTRRTKIINVVSKLVGVSATSKIIAIVKK